jgi:hypothetical protein
MTRVPQYIRLIARSIRIIMMPALAESAGLLQSFIPAVPSRVSGHMNGCTLTGFRPTAVADMT